MKLAMEQYWEELRSKDWESNGYHAGAFALEEAPTTGSIHIHFYVEHTQKTAWNLSKFFGVTQEAVFYDTVRSAKGSWNYCTGEAKHEGKAALDRWEFGEPILWGRDDQDSSLKWCVDQIIGGSHPVDILRQNAYAYAVHRSRIWALHHDVTELERSGTVKGPDSDITRP